MKFFQEKIHCDRNENNFSVHYNLNNQKKYFEMKFNKQPYIN